jgi:hypothetical protein
MKRQHNDFMKLLRGRVEYATQSSYPDAGQLPTGIDRALRLLIPLPVLIRNDQGESDGQA